MTEIAELWRFREVLLNLVRRNLKVRYKNSFFGFFWSLLNPLLQIGVWWFVFGVLWENNEKNYMALLLTGFLPWLFFSQTVLDSTACVTQEMALVKKAYFPRSILPLSALASNFIHLCFAFIVLIALFALWGVQVKVSYWLVIPSTLLIAVFAYGLSAMLAAWSVFYADVKFIVSNLLGLWFFLTPVLYPVASVLLKGAEAGNWLRSLINDALPVVKVLYLTDPVAVGILGYRSGLLYWGGSPITVTPNPNLTEAEALTRQATARALYPLDHYILAAAAVAVVTAVVGHFIFNRLSRQFAERG
jgi:lipopolysaccharide transport system permease protein